MNVVVLQAEPGRQAATPSSPRRKPALGAATAAGLAILAILIQGWHPYADDGGLYIAGVKRLLNPALYSHYTSFVLEQTRLSAFASVLATVIRVSHASFEPALFAIQFASIWATLFAAWLLAAACWEKVSARLGAVSLLACLFSLPVAGTALSIMDPYLTARSFSTPLGLLALAAIAGLWKTGARQRIWKCALCGTAVALGFLMHPVMAVYIAMAVLLLASVTAPVRSLRIWGCGAVCAGFVAVSFAAFLWSPHASAADTTAAMTRDYWFLSEWQWYELVGLIAPLAILSWYARAARQREYASSLAGAVLLLGATAVCVSLLFAHRGSSNLIARLQPLRAFHLVYIVMVMLLGAELGQRLLRRRALAGALALLVLAYCMYLPTRALYRHSQHIELYIENSPNQWVQAFLWIRGHTPVNALFALDADYNDAPDEDTQVFRAIAERSALPDRSKDGGVAAMAEQLAPAWLAGATAQKGLDGLSGMTAEQADRIREAALQPLGADWIVLTAGSPTALPCPYQNKAVKVCRLTEFIRPK